MRPAERLPSPFAHALPPRCRSPPWPRQASARPPPARFASFSARCARRGPIQMCIRDRSSTAPEPWPPPVEATMTQLTPV